MKNFLGQTLGPRLRAARRAKALTSVVCAKAVGVSQPAWNMWEMGVRLPKIELLAEICDLLGTTPNVLLGFEAPPAPAPSALSAPPRETNITTGDNSTVVSGGVNGSGNIVGSTITVTPPEKSTSPSTSPSTAKRKRAKK